MDFDKKIQLSQEILNYITVLRWPVIVSVGIFVFKDGVVHILKNGFHLGYKDLSITTSPISVKQKELQEKDATTKEEQLESTQQIEPESLSKTESPHSREEANAQITNLQVELELERAYTAIFGSQIALLKEMHAKTSVHELYVAMYFAALKDSNPLFSNWTTQNYTHFLIAEGLIEQKDHQYTITPKGIVFLGYIVSRNYSVEKPN